MSVNFLEGLLETKRRKISPSLTLNWWSNWKLPTPDAVSLDAQITAWWDGQLMSQHASIWLFYLVYTTLQHFFFSFFLSIYLPLFLSFLLVLVFPIFFFCFSFTCVLAWTGAILFSSFVMRWEEREERQEREESNIDLLRQLIVHRHCCFRFGIFSR